MAPTDDATEPGTDPSATAGQTAGQAARAALVEQVGADVVGADLREVAEGGTDAVRTCYFACTQPGYPGWEWAVTVVSPEGSWEGGVTVDELVLLPGADAIVAPSWVPYRERIRAGDLSPGDILPTDEDDERLVPTWLADDSDEADDTDPSGTTQGAQEQIRAVAKELGLGRTRVLSIEGRARTASRWLASDQGPGGSLAQQAPHPCWSCGFMVRLSGPLSDTFGVCGNEYANDDGRVVSFGHGCGAHSEAQLRKKQLPVPVPDPIIDTVTPEDYERF